MPVFYSKRSQKIYIRFLGRGLTLVQTAFHRSCRTRRLSLSATYPFRANAVQLLCFEVVFVTTDLRDLSASAAHRKSMISRVTL